MEFTVICAELSCAVTEVLGRDGEALVSALSTRQ